MWRCWIIYSIPLTSPKQQRQPLKWWKTDRFMFTIGNNSLISNYVFCARTYVCVFVNIGRIGKLFDGIPIIWTDALSMQKWSNILIGMSLTNYALVCVHLIIRLKIDADVNNITSHHQLHSNMTSSMKFGCLFTSLLLFVFLLQFPQCEWNEIEGTRVLCISIVSSQSISFPAFMRVREEVLKFTKNFAHLLTAWIALFEHTTC